MSEEKGKKETYSLSLSNKLEALKSGEAEKHP